MRLQVGPLVTACGLDGAPSRGTIIEVTYLKAIGDDTLIVVVKTPFAATDRLVLLFNPLAANDAPPPSASKLICFTAPANMDATVTEATPQFCAIDVKALRGVLYATAFAEVA